MTKPKTAAFGVIADMLALNDPADIETPKAVFDSDEDGGVLSLFDYDEKTHEYSKLLGEWRVKLEEIR